MKVVCCEMDQVDKEMAGYFLKNLLIELQLQETLMMKDFEDTTLGISDIKKKLKGWQQKHSEITIQKMKDAFKFRGKECPGYLSFKDFFTKIVEDHQSEQDIIEGIKSVNQSITNIKEIIKVQLQKDPNIYELS